MSELFLSAILRKLRPPYAQPARVIYGFSATEPANYGLTLEIPDGAPLVAPGDGVVDTIALLGGKWRNDTGVVRTRAIRIDHGKGVKTWVHGVASVAAAYGPVTRGSLLGTAQGPQVFFGIEQNGVFQDPTHVNSTFGIQDDFLNYGKARLVRQAPDVITNTFTDIVSLLASGVRYFFPPAPQQVLFNLDFNGQNTKTGPAAAGAEGDTWYIVAPLDFTPTPSTGYYGYGNCPGGTSFPAPQGFFLNDYRGVATKVFFERILLTANSGVSAFFDPMLSSWVGGYSGITPLVNGFSLRNLPSGTYDVYAYTNGGVTTDTTTVYFSADDGVPTPQVATPTVATAWIEGSNYLKDTLTVQNRGRITLMVYGYLAGVQVIRTSV